MSNCLAPIDPSRGLRAYFKKFGFSAGLHIGPTGALRIPLTDLKQVQLEVLQSQAEFEVLKTTAFGKNSDCPEPAASDTVPDLCHGEQQACSNRTTRVAQPGKGMDSHGSQAYLPHDTAEHYVDRTTSWRDLRLAEEISEEEEINRKKHPFSVWPLLQKLEPGTFSEMADSDFGFSMDQ
eukprot:s325_g24.t1